MIMDYEVIKILIFIFSLMIINIFCTLEWKAIPINPTHIIKAFITIHLHTTAAYQTQLRDKVEDIIIHQF